MASDKVKWRFRWCVVIIRERGWLGVDTPVVEWFANPAGGVLLLQFPGCWALAGLTAGVLFSQDWQTACITAPCGFIPRFTSAFIGDATLTGIWCWRDSLCVQFPINQQTWTDAQSTFQLLHLTNLHDKRPPAHRQINALINNCL